MANICRTKRDRDNRARVLESTKGLLRSQNFMNFGPQTASNSTAILPTLPIFYISLSGFADGHQQTELNQALSSNGP